MSTFGNINIGTLSGGTYPSNAYGIRHTLPTEGAITSISVYLVATSAGTNAKAALYDASYNLLSTSSELPISTTRLRGTPSLSPTLNSCQRVIITSHSQQASKRSSTTKMNSFPQCVRGICTSSMSIRGRIPHRSYLSAGETGA